MDATTRIKVKNPPQMIDTVKIPGMAGLIGITSCPGVRPDMVFDVYGESLVDDLLDIRVWGAAVVVTLLEDAEMNLLGVRDLGSHVVTFNMIWLHLPIRNTALPDERFEEKWRQVMPSLCSLLREGQRVVIHCKEGIGRAGLVAARLLIELGVPVEEAMTLVRRSRPGSLYLYSHEKYCHEVAEKMNSMLPAAGHADSNCQQH